MAPGEESMHEAASCHDVGSIGTSVFIREEFQLIAYCKVFIFYGFLFQSRRKRRIVSYDI